MSAVGRFVACAEAQIGKPYRWGTAGPRTFDCSGLVRFCYREATGREITGSSHQQFTLGRRVKRLKPGDLIFYDTSGDGAGHVGIVVGKDRAVHALNAQLGIRETRIEGANLGGPFIGARRLPFGKREKGEERQ